MKVLVLGASGIVGQHMRLCIPDSVEPVWIRRHADPITHGCDLASETQLNALLYGTRPDVIVNLAGESSVDIVEREPDRYMRINAAIPAKLAAWAQEHGKRMIQISTQAVHGGDRAPYGPEPADPNDAVNLYGVQKAMAEQVCLSHHATIIRLTFILGIRPLPHDGRQNPLEAMLAGQPCQVNNRWFSPLIAWDAAELIWDEVISPSGASILQFGIDEGWSRFQIGLIVNPEVNFIRHEEFEGIAPRPFNVTYRDSYYAITVAEGIRHARQLASNDRALELALFFGYRLENVIAKLELGFGALHNDVTADFNRVKPANDLELLEWYRTTKAYVWELSAYHDDPGFNYAGMAKGIADRLYADACDGISGPSAYAVLSLGDGIGDMTLAFHHAGLNAVYHDLKDSVTAKYAAFRFWRQTGCELATDFTSNWDAADSGFGSEPEFYNAIVSADFLEHVPNVDEWVKAIHNALVPGGLFFAQNAFACGSGADGAMPMHLAVNDRYEKDWDPLLAACGFEQLASNWYRKL